MQEFAPYQPNLKQIKRQQAVRFGVPVLVFSLLMTLLVAAVYYAQQDERDQNQAKLIADALWARQNIQFQVGSLINSLQALTNDSLIYPSPRLAASLNQLGQSSGELVAVFKGQELTLWLIFKTPSMNMILRPFANLSLPRFGSALIRG